MDGTVRIRGERGKTKGKKGGKHIRPQHPSPMLINLQTPNIPPRHAQPARSNNSQQPNPRLRLQRPPKSATGNHQSASHTSQEQKNNNITIDAVQTNPPVPDGGHELQYYE